tara:strand:- start:10574 stop:11443 length:870 start_codon:yes stop_codon:yes gene_type:complete
MRINLSSIQVFEIAARNLSFKAAASQLHLSPSAVSHAISKLESELGALLFDRNGRRVSLTADGIMLLAHVEDGLSSIRAGFAAVAGRQAQTLRLHASPSFAAQWLTPRLQSFFAANPGMEVQIAADSDYTRFTDDQFDADIIYGEPVVKGVVCHSLGEERVLPLCAPSLAKRISRPKDLLDHVLIYSTLKKVTWDDWFKANGITPAGGSTMRFDRSFMAISAATDGQGICLDSDRLAERELKTGRLVAPLRGLSHDPIDTGHKLVYPSRNAKRPIVKHFTEWILSEIGG